MERQITHLVSNAKWPLVCVLALGAALLLMGNALPPSQQLSAFGNIYMIQGKQLVEVHVPIIGGTSRGGTPSTKPIRDDVSQLFDWQEVEEGTRFLVSLGSLTPSTQGEALHGSDLVLLDERGQKRLIGRSVVVASFSPDGKEVAYITDSRALMVKTLAGEMLAAVQGAVQFSWSTDGRKIVFTQAAPEQSDERAIGLLDLSTKQAYRLTTGQVDYSPVFDPSGKWILFINAGRTRIGSFWALSVTGGAPIQLTNVGVQQVDERVVPIPNSTAQWSPDGTTLLYDCCRQDGRSNIWTLKFDPTGPGISSAKLLSEGSAPRWLDSDHIVVEGNANTFTVLEAYQ